MPLNEIIGIIKILGIVAAVWIAFCLLRFMARWLARAIESALYPVERRMLYWLQDRANARVLGVDVEIIRQRRRIDTTDRPIDYSGH